MLIPNYLLATPLAAELRRQVKEVNGDLLNIQSGRCRWFDCGSKKDVPDCACYVGHYNGCDCECYVWVLPEFRKEFEDFTLKILGFSDLIKETQVMSIPGVRFSPSRR